LTLKAKRKDRYQQYRSAAMAPLLILLAGVEESSAGIQFEDVTPQANLAFTGESYGASWGDRNGDGLPDLFVNHHRGNSSLYINLGAGVFEDRGYEIAPWTAKPWADQHGGTWVDFDNDGDQDLIVSVGRADVLQFLVNNGQTLDDMSVEYGFAGYKWGGRMPVWVDFTGDGWLDWGMTILLSPLAHFAQVPGQPPAQTFVRQQATATGNNCKENQYVQLADLNNDGALELICPDQTLYPQKIYDLTTPIATDITSIIPPVSQTVDSVMGDFDGNLQTDMFVMRGIQRLSGADITGEANTKIEGAYITGDTTERGFTFVNDGELTIRIYWNNGNASRVFIGADGYRATGVPGVQYIDVPLSAADPANVGVQPHNPATTQGIYIGFDPDLQTWTVLISPGGKWNYAAFIVESTTTITNLVSIGLKAADSPIKSVLYMNEDGVFSDQAATRGLGLRLPCVSGVSADFDNDMDLDLFLVCRGAVDNLQDRMYENTGAGHFSLVPNSGAEGPTGIDVGLGENVVVADYDVDGLPDLFVTNGLALFPETRVGGAGGPDLLFKNRTTNGNHWVQVDLVGTTANRDAIGAKVYATAGGVPQVREQNGGYHRWAQNDKRIHFGLGPNDTVDLEVHWPSPSNRVETFEDVPANLVYRITEGTGIEASPLATSVPPSPCIKPQYSSATDAGVFLWKDCDSGVWHLRSSSAGGSWANDGTIFANQAFDSVTAVTLEAADRLDYTTDPNRIDFAFKVTGTGQDGFDFANAAGGPLCFDMKTPTGAPIYVGHLRRPVDPPFDLGTMGACTNLPPTVSVSDVTVDESDPSGAAVLTIALTAASTSTVTVDLASTDQTAKTPDDYTPVLETVTFAPGETTKVLNVAIHDDPLAEGVESFGLSLSNPSNAILGVATAKVTINDDEASPCGVPAYNLATEAGIFLWQDCNGTGAWHARMTSGSGAVTYRGTLFADRAFAQVTGFSIEALDTINATSDPTRIAYVMNGKAGTQDGVDFTIAPNSSVCFTVDTPASIPVYVGAARTQVVQPFDLATLGICGDVLPPTISIADVTVAENGNEAIFTVVLSKPSTAEVTVDAATVDGTATAPEDYTALPPQRSIVFAPGETSRSGLAIAIQDDDLPELAEYFTLTLSNPLNAIMGIATARATIVDDEPSPCGTPTYDRTAQQGIFLWKDCPNGQWHARMTTGAASATFSGSLNSDQAFTSIAGFNLEATDVLDYTSDPARISYQFSGGVGSQDGADFSVAPSANACFVVDAPEGTAVYVGAAGAAGTPMSAPFNLRTLGACTP